ncbi:unnamed protein product, partial [Rotaria sp. Silwood2]
MANFVAIQRYESSSESGDEMEIDQQDIQEKKQVRRKIVWIKDNIFSDDNEFQIAIKQEKQWSLYYTSKGHDGIKVHYRCNQVHFR